MNGPTRADVCCVAVAECFRGDGELVANPIGTIPMIGGRLARASFEPDLVMTDGEAMFVTDERAAIDPGDPRTVEAWNPYRRMFDVVWSGRRHVMMGATQVDRYGNQNIAAIGPDYARPRAMLLGFRGAPGNTINHTTSYWVPNHSPKVLVEAVDVVCGIGYDRAATLGAAARWHEIRAVVTNLCVLDFDTPDHSMRLRSLHPGVTVDDVVAATGCALTVPDGVPDTRWPTDDELRLLADIDPAGARGKEVRDPCSALATRFTELVGCRWPIVQTGMGWVSGPELTTATSAAGGFGILASVTMTLDELRAAIDEVRECTPGPFGVNVRADQPDLGERIDLCAAGGVRLVSFAGAPTADAVRRIHDGGLVCMPTVGARRHAEKVLEMGVDAVIAQGGEGGGHTGQVPTSLLLPQVVDAVGDAVPVLGAGGFHDGRGLVAALAWGADGVAMGTRFLLTRESRVPDAVKARYLATGVFDTVVTTAIDGAPQRVIRTELIDRLERSSVVTRLPRALRSALGFRRLTGTPVSALVKEGLAMRRSQDLTWSEVAMAANAAMLTRASMVDGNLEVGILPTGQNVGVIGELPTVAELVDRIVADAETTLKRLAF